MWKYLILCVVFWSPIWAYAFDDATLTWTHNGQGITGFHVYSSDSATGVFTKESVIIGSTVRTITVSMRFATTFYKMTATNQGVESAFSNTGSKVSAPVVVAPVYFKFVVDQVGIKWGLVTTAFVGTGGVIYDVYRDDVKTLARALDVRVRNGIAEVKGESNDGWWWSWNGNAWIKTVQEVTPVPLPVPTAPSNLLLSEQTLDTMTIVASAGACTKLVTKTPTTMKRVVTCVH